VLSIPLDDDTRQPQLDREVVLEGAPKPIDAALDRGLMAAIQPIPAISVRIDCSRFSKCRRCWARACKGNRLSMAVRVTTSLAAYG
jgi:hypothetical protein